MKPDELLLRRQRLLARSAQLRVEFAQQADALRRPLAIVDQARQVLNWLAANPGWPLAGALLLVLWRPRRALVWGGRLWWGWRSYRQARAWLTRAG